MAVVIVARAAILEHDHRPDRTVPLDVRDVIALDPFRRRLQVERLGQRREHRLGPAFVVIGLYAQLLQLLSGGLGHLCDKRSLPTTLWHLDRHRSAAPLAQPPRHELHLVQRPGKDHGSGHVSGARVVLEDEAAQQLRLRCLAGTVERVTVVADHLSIPHVSDLDVDLATSPRVRDDVVVVAAVREHLLAVRDLFNRLQLVAIARRILEVELVRGAFHALV